MPSEQCEICGEETDADVIDEHGHFALPDDDDFLDDEEDEA